MSGTRQDRPLTGAVLVWALIFAVLPALVAGQSAMPRVDAAPAHRQPAPRSPAPLPPPVEPLEMATLRADEARAINAAVPFSRAPNPAARPYRFIGALADRLRAVDCLAAAMLYEAGDDPEGERAVGQVVLNRLRHPAFPKTVCGVVFQGQERRTGCQFTFTCDGAMARRPNPAAWERARQLASAMLSGEVYGAVGHATHYHTDWVVPYWSASLAKVTAVGTHLFFRWQGWWGTPGAFNRAEIDTIEPMIARLAPLSPAHAPGASVLAAAGSMAPAPILDAAMDLRPAIPLGPEQIGQRFAVGRLVAVEPEGTGYVLALDRSADPASLAVLARRLCAGRPLCRLMGWTSGAPTAFPLAYADLRRMSWSYIRRSQPAFERMLFHCAEFPGRPAPQCMVDRAGPLPRPVAREPQAASRRAMERIGWKPLPSPPAGDLAGASGSGAATDTATP